MDAPDHLDISLDQLINLPGHSTYIVRVSGDSMEGAGIFDGDILVVDKGLDARAGDIVIGIVNQEPLVKFLVFAGGHPILRATNRKYPDRHVLEDTDFQIWGVVTHSARAHQWGG